MPSAWAAPQQPLPALPGESSHLEGAPGAGTSRIPLGCVAGSLFPVQHFLPLSISSWLPSPAPPFLPVVQHRIFLGLNFLLLSVPRPSGVILRASHPTPTCNPGLPRGLTTADQGEGQVCKGECLGRQLGPKGLESYLIMAGGTSWKPTWAK